MTQIVSESAGLEQLCARIRAASRVGIDTEFHNERTYAARLMVVQLAFDDGVAIVDPLMVGDLAPLVAALCTTTVVGHALSSDLKILADRFACVPEKIFDCQIAAAFLGYGLAISLADLVRDLRGVRLKKTQTVSDWSKRPLSAQQLDYLQDDVRYLLPMYETLERRLREKGRLNWAVEEFRQLGDVQRYQVDERRAAMRIPGANRMNRRELGVLSELLQMRDRFARERDVPLRYILPDDVVSGLAVLRPKQLDELGQLRRLDAGARRTYGEAILEAVRRGEAIPDDELPNKIARPLGPLRETLVSLMSVIAGEIAGEHDLPPSLLVPRASLEKVAREVPRERGEFERALGLSQWRTDLLAESLWKLLSGTASVRIEGYSDRDPRILLQQ